MNKKIQNATITEYNGVKFKSKLEAQIYKCLIENNFHPEYESDTITLLPSFRPETPWFMNGRAQTTTSNKNNIIRAITYTPDFKIAINDTIIYLEVKGIENDVFPIKRKLFLNWIEKQDKHIVFVEIKSVSGLKQFLKTISL